jgi:hypothetical protein
MSWLQDRRFLRAIPWLILFFAVPAFAQFEVAPDHFDSSETDKTVHKTTVKKKAKTVLPATSLTASSATALTASPTTAVRVAPGQHKRNVRRVTSNASQSRPKKISGQISPGIDQRAGAQRKRVPAGSIAATGSPSMH